jgi:hypothetical protein
VIADEPVVVDGTVEEKIVVMVKDSKGSNV